MSVPLVVLLKECKKRLTEGWPLISSSVLVFTKKRKLDDHLQISTFIMFLVGRCLNLVCLSYKCYDLKMTCLNCPFEAGMCKNFDRIKHDMWPLPSNTKTRSELLLMICFFFRRCVPDSMAITTWTWSLCFCQPSLTQHGRNEHTKMMMAWWIACWFAFCITTQSVKEQRH